MMITKKNPNAPFSVNKSIRSFNRILALNNITAFALKFFSLKSWMYLETVFDINKMSSLVVFFIETIMPS